MTSQTKGPGVQPRPLLNRALRILDLTPCESKKAAQRGLILDALACGSLSTVAAREDLGVLHPAARVLELRRAGWPIDTVRQSAHDAEGRCHRVAFYVLSFEGGVA